MIIKGKPVYVYDIEVFPNVFHCTVKNTETKQILKFEISERINQAEELISFFWCLNPDNLSGFTPKDDICICGYNNKHYDDAIINFIIDNRNIVTSCDYLKACKGIARLSDVIILSGDDTSQWKQWKYKKYFYSFDLLTMLFSSKLRVGLKEMQVTMQYNNVQEYEGDFTQWLPKSEIDKMIEYNINDVESTEALLYKCEKAIKLRLSIEEEYNVDVLSKDGMSIGVEILKNKYLEKTHKSWYQIKDLRSPCDMIVLKDVILPYIKYDTTILQNLLTEMKNLTVSPGRKGYEKHFLFGGIEVSVGVGGIHSVHQPEIFIPKEDEFICDCDVASLYPSLSISYEFYPPHLGHEFIEVYSQIKKERIEAKHNGNKIKNETYKLALNGTTGNYQQEHSWLYSPVTAMQIRINGQLLLLMLAEKLVLNGCTLIQLNTDGIFYRAKKSNRNKVQKICKEWEQLTKLELEEDEYSAFFQYAINDYIAVGRDYYLPFEGKDYQKGIKTKGMFLTDITLGKGMPSTIIPEAIIKEMVDDIPVETTIRECKDLNKFLTYQKVGKEFLVEYDGKLIQRINRFYMSTNGAYLFKCKRGADNKLTNYEKINAQSGVTIVNKLSDITEFPNNINYQYYIGQAKSIVNEFKVQQLKLFEV